MSLCAPGELETTKERNYFGQLAAAGVAEISSVRVRTKRTAAGRRSSVDKSRRATPRTATELKATCRTFVFKSRRRHRRGSRGDRDFDRGGDDDFGGGSQFQRRNGFETRPRYLRTLFWRAALINLTRRSASAA